MGITEHRMSAGNPPPIKGIRADVARCNGRDLDFETELKHLRKWGRTCPLFGGDRIKCLKFHLPIGEVDWSPDYPEKCRIGL